MTQPPTFDKDWLAPRYWPVWWVLGVMWVIAHLPYRVQMAFGSGLGRLLYYVVGSRRRVAQKNIALAFPNLSPKEQRQLVKAVFRESGKALPETCMAWFRDPCKLSIDFSVEGIDLLRNELATGHGVLLLGAHFTSIDICGALLSSKVDIDSLHRPHDNPLMNYFQCKGRLRNVTALIEKKDMRNMIRLLKQGRIIFYAPDQDLGRNRSIFVPFFGVPTATVTATAKLAHVAQCRVYMGSNVRTKNGYRMTVSDQSSLFSGDIEADTRAYNAWLEARVRENPAQYLWLHKRFKTRPEGEAKIY